MRAKLLDITEWEELRARQTEGTRDKRVLISPHDHLPYYFKTSLLRQHRDYRFEFWSEVIASRIGRYLGFDVLNYDVATITNEDPALIGCISRSIHNEQNGELMIPGYRLLCVISPKFENNFKETGAHNLALIKRGLEPFKASCPNIFEQMLGCFLFDVIIGNGDRHSENWAILCSSTSGNNNTAITILGLTPIYDSGSSLARELDENRVMVMLNNNTEFEKYLQKGRPDITVLPDKGTTFFKALPDLLKQYSKEINPHISRLTNITNNNLWQNELRDIVFGIDKDIRTDIPEEYRLTDKRKELITRLITERLQRMLEIITTSYGHN